MNRPRPSRSRARRSRPGGRLPPLFVLCALLLPGGCVERTLLVRTESRARPVEVFIDGKYRGTAPYRASFLYYGTHEVMLRDATGARSVRDVRLDRPWYAYFPLDFFAEVLLPVRVEETHEFVLPAPRAETRDFDEIEKNAHAFRSEFFRLRGPHARR